jgi:hypothetical protein
MVKEPAINFRPEPDVIERLRGLAEMNERTLADELRAATSIYVHLHNLGRIRTAGPDMPAMMRQKIEERTKEALGQIFLAAAPAEVRDRFERDLADEYPKERIEPLDEPFERVLGWLNAGA